MQRIPNRRTKKHSKAKIILIILTIGLPIVYLLNQVLFYFMPSEYRVDGEITQEGLLWFIGWSSSLSMVTLLMIVSVLIRIWVFGKKD